MKISSKTKSNKKNVKQQNQEYINKRKPEANKQIKTKVKKIGKIEEGIRGTEEKTRNREGEAGQEGQKPGQRVEWGRREGKDKKREGRRGLEEGAHRECQRGSNPIKV